MGEGRDVEDREASENGRSERRSHDPSALRATQEEVRAVLDHQLQTSNDVDDKAAMTSRLNVLLLGLLFTAGSFFAQADAFDATPYFNAATAAGTVLFVPSFALSIATYTRTEVEMGPGPEDVLRLIDARYSETAWLLLLLRSEAQWMRDNERAQSLDGTILTASHVALVLGIGALTTGVALVHW